MILNVHLYVCYLYISLYIFLSYHSSVILSGGRGDHKACHGQSNYPAGIGWTFQRGDPRDSHTNSPVMNTKEILRYTHECIYISCIDIFYYNHILLFDMSHRSLILPCLTDFSNYGCGSLLVESDSTIITARLYQDSLAFWLFRVNGYDVSPCMSLPSMKSLASLLHLYASLCTQ